MPSHTGFSLRDLFQELELRFAKELPLTSPELLGYYLAFLLLDHPLDETWLILLDSRKRLLHITQITESTLFKDMYPPLLQKDARAKYYCFVHTHGDLPTTPSSADIYTNRSVTTYHGSDPNYLGAYIVNQALDFRFLSPQKFE